MDLNYLYGRQQVSLVMAERADSAEARRIHREFADQYGARIAAARLARTELRAA